MDYGSIYHYSTYHKDSRALAIKYNSDNTMVLMDKDSDKNLEQKSMEKMYNPQDNQIDRLPFLVVIVIVFRFYLFPLYDYHQHQKYNYIFALDYAKIEFLCHMN